MLTVEKVHEDDIEDLNLDHLLNHIPEDTKPKQSSKVTSQHTNHHTDHNSSKHTSHSKINQNRSSKRDIEQRKQNQGYNIIPGIQTVYFKTYGCSHNQSDSEYMAGQLVEKGYAITDDFDKADVYLINSCTVKNPSQDSMKTVMDKAKDTNKPVIVTGCVPQGEKKSKMWDDVSVIGVQQIQHVNYVIEESLKGHKVHLFSRTKDNRPSLSLPKVRQNPFIEIIPINVGCLNQCTYCKTKHARGDLGSWSIEEICDRFKKVIAEGVKEIRMTSEDTGAYGRDIGTNISELLRAVVKLLPDGVMLRIGMTNPPYMKDHLKDIAEVLNHPNVYSFLHIPVQSGNDKVLYDMRREYTVQDFKDIVQYLRKHVPHISLATDFICGFPTETAQDFEDTLKLAEECKFEFVNISQFYPRPGTPAARMKRVKTQEVKDRSRKLTQLFNSYTNYDYLLGTKQRVWITETARDGHHLVGHTKNYVQTLIDPSEASMGSSVWVEITQVDKFFVKGHVIPQPLDQRVEHGDDGEVKQTTQTTKVTKTPKSFSVRGNSDDINDSSKQDTNWFLMGFILVLFVGVFWTLFARQ